MKIGFFSESTADQAAIAIFTSGILGAPPEPIGMDLQGHGVTQVLGALQGVFRGLHYNSDAEGLVVVVDSDETALHELSHDEPDGIDPDCRLCQVRSIIAQVKKHLKPRAVLPELKVAVGLAVPAIEAWYLVGKDHQVGEAAWKVGLEGRRPFTRPQLKKMVYGTDRPSLERETECAIREATRIVNIEAIEAIENAFPAGFGSMAQEIRTWTQQRRAE